MNVTMAPNARNIATWCAIAVALSVAGWWWYAQQTPAAADPQNATYTIEGTPVTLVGGLAEVPSAPGSASRTVTRYFGNEAAGDLNGDGLPDAAFILTQDGGGSGTFYYVVAALRQSDGTWVGTNGVLLGDRVAPQPTQITDGEVIANFAERAPGEPMTTRPSVGVSKYLRVVGGILTDTGGE